MRTRSLLLSSALAAPFIMGANANTLTRLIPDIYAALDTVSRELVGFIPSVGRAPGAERAALGQSVVYQVSPTMPAQDIVPGMTNPTPPDFAMGNGTITINKARKVPFGFTGEEQRGLNTGTGYMSAQAALIAQAMRTLVNEMETDLAVEASLKGSRAYGTPGTTPFATNLSETAQVRKILDDNGAPAGNRSLVMDTSAGASLRTLQNLTRVSEAGNSMTLRDGELLNVHGLSLKESAQVQRMIKGTGAGATTNAAGYAVGATAITIASAGTGTVKAGDVVTFAGDSNKYVVASGDTDVSNGGVITIAAPGLRVAIPAAATAITIGNSYTANVGFTDTALHLVTRLPALPEEGDNAVDRMTVTDIRSGITFEIAIYTGYRMIAAEVAVVWGVKAVKPEHIAVLQG